MLEFLYNKGVLRKYKVSGSFIKKRLQHRCFPVKFVKFLRKLILKNICERMFLYICVNFELSKLIGTLQALHVYSTLKQRGKECFHVALTWNTRGVFVGKVLEKTLQIMVSIFAKNVVLHRLSCSCAFIIYFVKISSS